MKTATSVSDIPAGSHWAILHFDSVLIPGDERSRTNPGHGYPERTETTSRYVVYTNEVEWLNDVGHYTTSRNHTGMPCVPLIVNRPRINVDVSVTVSDK